MVPLARFAREHGLEMRFIEYMPIGADHWERSKVYFATRSSNNIFMITTPLLENSVNLVIPSSGAANAPVNPAQVQTISIDRTEAIRLNNQQIDPKTLATRLVELKRANPDVAIVIRPDRELPVQKLVSLMDTLQRAQITKVGIATKAESK